MDDLQNTAVSLSQEELFVILTYLRVNSLMGLNGAILSDLPEAHIRLILGVAERALVAREFLVRNEGGNFELTPAILSIVGGCAKPDQSLIINYDRLEHPTETLFFHRTGSLLIGHTIPLSAIHQFVMIDSPDLIQQTVVGLLALGSQAAPYEQQDLINIPQLSLNSARTAAADGDLTRAQTILSEASMSVTMSEALAASLANPIANVTLLYLKHQEDTTAFAEGFTILQGSNGFWILQPTEEETLPEDHVSIIPLSGQGVKKLIQKLISQL